MASIKKLPLLFWLYAVFWLSYFSYFFFNLFIVNANGDLTIGQANMWADWALHLTMTSAMSERELFLTESPLLSGQGFAYPYAINLISAILNRIGLSLIDAMVLPSYVFSLITILGLFYFFKGLFNSNNVALLASCLFLFNGGIGGYFFIQELLASNDPISLIQFPIKEYTHLVDEQIKWMNIIPSMLLPQRSLTMGLGLSLFALGYMLRYFQLGTQDNEVNLSLSNENRHRPDWGFYLAAIILGLMPIIHLHSFLASFIFLACWSIADLIYIEKNKRLKRFKSWFYFAVLVSIIALPILMLNYVQAVSENSIRVFWGWYAKEFEQDWLYFWFKNWTLIPTFALLGLFLLYRSSSNSKSHAFKALIIWLPGFIFFGLANSIILHPWIWDNTKILIWASIGFSGLSAWFIFYLYSSLNHLPLKCLFKPLVFTLVLLLCFSGAVDIYRNILLEKHRYVMYSKDELDMARWVKANTPIDSKWLISNQHNHWLSNLTGRQVLISYDGWLWSHGYPYQKITEDRKLLYQTANLDLIKKYQIDYIVFDKNTAKINPFALVQFAKQGKVAKHIGDIWVTTGRR